MAQPTLDEFLKEHEASIGAQLYGDMKNNIWVSGVYGRDGRWLVVSHDPECSNIKRCITHIEPCESVASVFEKSEGLVKDVEANPQKYLVKKE